MAMAGLMKGHGGYSNASRGRPYGMMLLLAFGIAIIGVMALHRFRERRIFNLLIKEKDTDLISLNLLLQKEREHVKEAKWKLEDMRAKTHTLRAQKKELDNRIKEMQSTVSSLREEQKTIESALEEKENEIKMLRVNNTNIENENQRVKALSEAFRHRESENEDWKYQQKAAANIWSVSTDDPSNASLNSQMKSRAIEWDEANFNQRKESRREFNVSANQEAGENLTEHADSRRGDSGKNSTKEVAKQGDLSRDNGGETAESRKMIEEQSQQQDHSVESNTEERITEGEGKNNGKSQNTGEEMGTAKQEAVRNHDNEVQRPRDETNEGHTSGDKAIEIASDSVLDSNAQGADNQEHGENLKEGMKSQVLYNSQIGRHGRKGKRSNLKRAKAKRRTIMTRSKARNSENMKLSDSVKNGEASEHEDTIDAAQEARNTASYQLMKGRESANATSIITEIGHISLKDAVPNVTLQIGDTSDDSPGEQAIEIQQSAEEIAKQKEDEVSKQSKASDFDEESDNPEIEDTQEPESETETSRKSRSTSEADGEERENDEPEF